jgi:TPP-dependent pyruvate/acetoin dehydrogenase alpha subunit
MATRKKQNDAATTVGERDADLLRRIYEIMVLTRAVEDRMVAMYKGGDLLGSLYTGHWHEAISVGSAAALRPDDYLAPIHRDLGAHLWRGIEPWQVMASFMGKATSPTGGRDGTLHYGRLDLNIYNLPSHIPANYPVAVGMGFAAKYRGEDKVSLAFCGDGSTSRADWHESINIAAVHLRRREQPVRLFDAGGPAVGVGDFRDQVGRVRDTRDQGRRDRRPRGPRRRSGGS